MADGAVAWDDSALDVFGVEPGDWQGEAAAWQRLVHPMDLPRVLKCVEEASRTHGAYSVVCRIRRHGGGYRRVEFRGHCALDGQGASNRLFGTVSEVAEQPAHDVAAWAPQQQPNGGLPRVLPDEAHGLAVDRTDRIAAMTLALASAITGQDVVNVVHDHMLPLFGATGVGIWVEEAGRVYAVGAAGYSQEFIDLFEGHPNEDTPPSLEAKRDRVQVFVSSPEEYLRRYPGLDRVVALSGKKAWAFLPLIASGRVIGCAVISYSRPHLFPHEERTLLTALSALVAQALARARLYDAEHDRARRLQQGLLPRALPPTPALTAAARYLPATEGTEVGGDWYDVIPLSGDRVALVVGDVMGHGLSEAATMGRLRTAVRTLADLELPPDELLYHLNDLVGGLGDDFYATCLYAVYDPTSGVCSIATAGHPPPAVADATGRVRLLDIPANPPLGAAAPPFDTSEFDLDDGSLLLLYTDGLVESSTQDIERGMARLAERLRAIAAKGHTDLDAVCDDLLKTMGADRRPTDDDTVLLVARTRRHAAEDIATWHLPTEPQAAGTARHHVRDQLCAWGLEELSPTTELLVSELVGNVVRHAKGPVSLRLLRSRTLICEVTDGSASLPRIRRAAETDEDGRGLQLIAMLAESWGARYTPDGKCIWTEQRMPVTESRRPLP
ncbi:SpoIIE family protein phosphatase (plasmid) [Embleya sp. NBC_00888]|uniref:SpoIIE family protein phosphatase n=1 Tax=Embleya sp. NBC_00888 TaxID=2975960 RepID=UPI002F9116C7|nr:SpoIIE family protein phosphatase [Embleya sp. NBC_00888]